MCILLLGTAHFAPCSAIYPVLKGQLSRAASKHMNTIHLILYKPSGSRVTIILFIVVILHICYAKIIKLCSCNFVQWKSTIERPGRMSYTEGYSSVHRRGISTVCKLYVCILMLIFCPFGQITYRSLPVHNAIILIISLTGGCHASNIFCTFTVIHRMLLLIHMYHVIFNSCAEQKTFLIITGLGHMSQSTASESGPENKPMASPCVIIFGVASILWALSVMYIYCRRCCNWLAETKLSHIAKKGGLFPTRGKPFVFPPSAQQACIGAKVKTLYQLCSSRCLLRHSMTGHSNCSIIGY